MREDEMRRVYLHIGPHKTGTTYIQRNLYNNKDILKIYGYFYPQPEEVYEEFDVVCHFELEDNPDKIENLIWQGTEEKVLISFEGLSLYSTEQIKRLKVFLKDFDVKVIFYVRNPANRFFSLWQEKIKHGETQSFLDFLIHRISQPFAAEDINYTLILSKWAEFFGKENIYLIDYDKGEDLFLLFLELIDFPKEHLDKLNIKKDKFNVSLRIEIAELIRLLNIFALKEDILEKNNIREAFLKLNEENKDVVKLSNEFENLIKMYIRNFKLEDYFLTSVQKKLIEEYGNNFYKGFTLWKPSFIVYIDDRYVFNRDIIGIVEIIYKYVKGGIL